MINCQGEKTNSRPTGIGACGRKKLNKTKEQVLIFLIILADLIVRDYVNHFTQCIYLNSMFIHTSHVADLIYEPKL